VQLNNRIQAITRKEEKRTREYQFLRITCDSSEEEHTGDAWASSAEEGRGTLRKAVVSCVQAREPQMSEWGNPAGIKPCHPAREGNRVN
jgi:hypothetical protein